MPLRYEKAKKRPLSRSRQRLRTATKAVKTTDYNSLSWAGWVSGVQKGKKKKNKKSTWLQNMLCFSIITEFMAPFLREHYTKCLCIC